MISCYQLSSLYTYLQLYSTIKYLSSIKVLFIIKYHTKILMSISHINQSLAFDSQDRKNSYSSLKESVIGDFQHKKYSIMVNAKYIQLFFYELIGMFLFVYGSNCYSPELQRNQQIMLSLMLGISMVGYLCGANFNPAVTLSTCMQKENKYKYSMLLIYLIAQIIGAILALMLGQLINDTTFSPLTPENTEPFTLIRIILAEMFGCFIWVFFILQISNPNTTFIENQLSGYFTIIAVVHVGRMFAFASGSVINISVTISLALVSATKSDYSGLQWLWIYILGNLLGTLLATFFYIFVFQPSIKICRQKRRNNQVESMMSYYSKN